eukprot:scaffold647888_cov35-Prasinocladus_malaysianus.AAC.1
MSGENWASWSLFVLRLCCTAITDLQKDNCLCDGGLYSLDMPGYNLEGLKFLLKIAEQGCGMQIKCSAPPPPMPPPSPLPPSRPPPPGFPPPASPPPEPMPPLFPPPSPGTPLPPQPDYHSPAQPPFPSQRAPPPLPPMETSEGEGSASGQTDAASSEVMSEAPEAAANELDVVMSLGMTLVFEQEIV